MLFVQNRIYMNSDGTLNKHVANPIFRDELYTTKLVLVAPFSSENALFTNILLATRVTAPQKRMKLTGTETVVPDPNFPGVTEEWNVWEYVMTDDILNAVAKFKATPIYTSFTEMEIVQDNLSIYEFVGYFNNIADLNTSIPNPDPTFYAGVNGTDTSADAYTVVNGVWVDSGTTIAQFEALNGINNTKLLSKTSQVTIPVDPSIDIVEEAVDVTVTDQILMDLAEAESDILELQGQIVEKVDEDFVSEYPLILDLDGDDVFVVQNPSAKGLDSNNPNALFRITYESLRELVQGEYKGEYADEAELLAAYPNNIPEPTLRTGWYAFVISTNTDWRWSVGDNNWYDTQKTGFVTRPEFLALEADVLTNAADIVTLDLALTQAQTDILQNAQDLVDHETEATGAHAASAISYDNTDSNLSSTDVKGALDELDSNIDGKVSKAGDTMIGALRIATQDPNNVAIRVAGQNIDTKVMRIDGNINEEIDGDFGFTLEYKGASTGDDNDLVLYADNQDAINQVEAIRVKQSGNVEFGQDVTIKSNLIVEGQTTTIDSTTVQIADRVVELAKDNTLPLTGYAGLAVRQYDGSNDGAMIIDSSGEFRVGDVIIEANGTITDVSTVPLAARDEVSNLETGDILTWDATTIKMIGKTTEELGLAVNGGTPNFDYVDFSTTQNPSHYASRLFYDSALNTLVYYNEDSEVSVSIGQDIIKPVTNGELDELKDGEIIYPSGIANGRFIVKRADSRIKTQSRFIGVVTSSMNSGEDGYVTLCGTVGSVDTSAFTIGDYLYLDENNPGQFTTTQPTDGSFPVIIGVVRKVGVTDGEIEVDIMRSFRTVEVDNQNGFNKEHQNLLSLSKIDNIRTFYINPANLGGEFHFYVYGEKFEKTGTQSIVWPDIEGTHYIYYDENGDLQCLTNPTDSTIAEIFTNNCAVAFIKWDATNKKVLGGIGRELHGIEMSPATHGYLHRFFGTQYAGGMTPGDLDVDGNGNDDSAAQLSISQGFLTDEDINHTIPKKLLTDTMEVFYNEGTAPNIVLRSKTAPVGFINTAFGGTGRAEYNNFDSGTNTWSLVEVGNNDYVLAHIFATNLQTDADTTTQYIVVMGQNTYNTILDARSGANDEINTIVSGLVLPEFVAVATFIIQTSDSYANTTSSRFRTIDTDGNEYVDWTDTVLRGAAGSGSTSHLNLTDTGVPGLHPLSSITNTPSGNITSTDGQSAINELDSIKVNNTGNESIAGEKTFTDDVIIAPIVPGGIASNSHYLEFLHNGGTTEEKSRLYVQGSGVSGEIGNLTFNTLSSNYAVYHAGNLTTSVIDALNVDAATLDGNLPSDFVSDGDFTTHEGTTGNGAHVPAAPVTNPTSKFLRGDGTFQVPNYTSSITQLSESGHGNRIWFTNVDGDWVALPFGTNGQVLTANGATTLPSWETFSDTNYYADSLSFSTSTGVLTIGRNGGLGDLTTDLDGRFLVSADGGLIGGDLTIDETAATLASPSHTLTFNYRGGTTAKTVNLFADGTATSGDPAILKFGTETVYHTGNLPNIPDNTDYVDLTSAQTVGGNKTFSNNVVVNGTLIVNGTTTTLNSTTVQVDDKNIELGVVDTPTDVTADGGGITLKGSTDKTIVWSNTTDSWEFNQGIISSENIKGSILISDVSAGTAPLTVSSNTEVTNLNTNYLQGQNGAYYLNYNNFTNTPNLTNYVTTNTVQTITADKNFSGLITMDSGALVLRNNSIENHLTDSDAGEVAVNYRGYLNGTTKFRDLTVYDGKNAIVAKFDGSVKSLEVNGQHIVTRSGANGVFVRNDTSNTSYAGLGVTSGLASIYAGSGASNNVGLTIYTATGGNETEKMRITHDGNVGIGTTSPNYKLEVNGTISGNILRSSVSAGTAPLIVASNTEVTNLNTNYLQGQNGAYYLNYNNFTNTPSIPDNSDYVDLSSTQDIGGVKTFENDVYYEATTLWTVSSSDAARQRTDARTEDTNKARLHWYGQTTTGSNTSARHAFYDGSSYVNFTAESGGITIGGNLTATELQEGGTALSDLYLGKTAKAADSDKLDNLNSTSFVRSDATDTISGAITHTNTLKMAEEAAVSGANSEHILFGYRDGGTASTADVYVDGSSTGTEDPTLKFKYAGTAHTIYHTGNLVASDEPEWQFVGTAESSTSTLDVNSFMNLADYDYKFVIHGYTSGNSTTIGWFRFKTGTTILSTQDYGAAYDYIYSTSGTSTNTHSDTAGSMNRTLDECFLWYSNTGDSSPISASWGKSEIIVSTGFRSGRTNGQPAYGINMQVQGVLSQGNANEGVYDGSYYKGLSKFHAQYVYWPEANIPDGITINSTLNAGATDKVVLYVYRRYKDRSDSI